MPPPPPYPLPLAGFVLGLVLIGVGYPLALRHKVVCIPKNPFLILLGALVFTACFILRARYPQATYGFATGGMVLIGILVARHWVGGDVFVWNADIATIEGKLKGVLKAQELEFEKQGRPVTSLEKLLGFSHSSEAVLLVLTPSAGCIEILSHPPDSRAEINFRRVGSQILARQLRKAFAREIQTAPTQLIFSYGVLSLVVGAGLILASLWYWGLPFLVSLRLFH